MPYFFLGIVRGHIVRSTYFDDGLYDGLELTTIGWQRSIKIAIDSQGSKFFYYFEEQKTYDNFSVMLVNIQLLGSSFFIDL